jgi:chemotaxis protein MotB
MRFSAVGVGSSRPLASNETRQGRALNRRVDLLIMPQGAGAAH